MSPARMLSGTVEASAAAASGEPRATRCPMRNATSAMTAIPGTIHGRTDFALVVVALPTPALQRGQGVVDSGDFMSGKLSELGHSAGWRRERDLPGVRTGADIQCRWAPRGRPIPLREVSVAGHSRSLLDDLTGATKRDILKLAEAHGVRFLRLTFTDILGVNKNVEIPSSQFSKALDGDIMFDGSSIEGFVRIEESDMLLTPDLSTFKVFPGGDPQSR